MERTVIDCDLCESKDVEDYVTIRMKDSVDSNRADRRVHLCSSCAMAVMKESYDGALASNLLCETNRLRIVKMSRAGDDEVISETSE
ncbi:MAG: hypothetical protein DRN81_03750 [Thermoproteota archaeon]|nr:MAG: hypothetical protein DRN81_03750 [Candidatus Korarchaeota archaeon]